MNKVYTLEHKGYEFDDLDYGSFYIIYASLDKSKIIERFNKEKEWHINVIEKEQNRIDKDDIYKEDYQIYKDEPDYFEAWCGKWCYEYRINEYELI